MRVPNVESLARHRSLDNTLIDYRKERGIGGLLQPSDDIDDGAEEKEYMIHFAAAQAIYAL